MPCDPQLQEFDDTELVSTLSELEIIIANNSDCEVVLAADMNWDTSRDNHFTRTVARTVDNLGLTSVWQGRNIDFTHTHTDGKSHSTLDHFLLSRPLLELVDGLRTSPQG